jgi:hypothetical protein
MIRQLTLIAALLAPGLAYGQVTFPSPTVNPAGAPSAPAPAQAAGFTTCVVCIDFTQASGGVWINGAAVAGVNAAQPKTWLDCAGASNPIWFHGVNYAESGEAGLDTSCPDIITDTTVSPGTRVLRIQQGTNSGGSGTACSNGTCLLSNGIKLYSKNQNKGIASPTGHYVEAELVLVTFPNAIGDCASNCAKGYSNWTWADGAAATPNYNSFEFDSFEINGYAMPTQACASFDAGVGSWINGHFTNSNWYGACPPTWVSHGFNFVTEYLAVGSRFTHDGSSTGYRCTWIGSDANPDVFQNCVNFSANGTTVQTSQFSDGTSRMNHDLEPVQTQLIGTQPPSIGPMVAYVKHFYEWSCPSWQTTACKTSSANPGGY